MTNRPITLTLVCDTEEQAHMVLEAYGAAMSGAGSTRVEAGVIDATTEIPPYKPAAHPNPAPGYAGNVGLHDAAPGTHGTGTATELDERGVPYNADFHSSSKKQSKGKWDRKRGHDRAAADAYEAQFAHAAPVTAAPAAVAMPSAAAPSVQAPQPMGPTLAQFQDLWVWCCSNNKVTMADQIYIENTWGSHPMAEGAANAFNDVFKRSMAFAHLQQKANA
jgi:hypothetical protein